MYNELTNENVPIYLTGVGKSSHMSSLSNWTNGNNTSVCADESPYSTWLEWGANQRDLYILDHEGSIAWNGSVSSGIPSNLEEIILLLLNVLLVELFNALLL